MPGTRSSRISSAVSHKSSIQTLNSRASAASRISAPYVEIPPETAESALRVQICSVFKDSQRSTASHRTLVINLRKIQEACFYEPTSKERKVGMKVFDEKEFNEEVTRCVLRILPVKKSESAGDRVIRFLGLFLCYANEKDNELEPAADDEAGTMLETPNTRLTAHVMTTIFPLLSSKDKFVRYRATQLTSHIVNSIDSMEDDLFQTLRAGLLKRIRDKEAMVRVQAVLGLGRLAASEVEDRDNSGDSDDDSSVSLLEKLLDILQNDPSADVRRSLLVNLPILPNTLPYLMERARDQDPATRRVLYSRLLPALGDFRHLSLSMREKLLRWGLRDRDENVRKAAGRLFRERWVGDCAGASVNKEGGPVNDQTSTPNFEALLELLERIDVVNSGVENGVALEAMRGFWEGRPDYRDEVSFDDAFWDTLSAESAFMARSFNDFCRNEGNNKFEALIEEKMPEVTKLVYHLQRYIAVLVEALKKSGQQNSEDDEEDTVEQEFIVEQLLYIARTLDYADEVGRRGMFALLRQSLSVPDLPEEVTRLIIEVLRGISAGDAAGEREFCSVVLEAVADIHDTIMDETLNEYPEESFHSAKSEVTDDGTTAPSSKKAKKSPEEERDKAVREIVINMKCLHIVQCMLQNVQGNLQENADLVGMLNNLVVPAVRSHEAPVRERGLVCLGLCAMLDKSLAEENLTLFMHFFSKGHAALQITALHILTDILTQHGSHVLETNPALLKVYVKALKSGSRTPEVQAAATISVCKLMLGRVVQDFEASTELLKALIIAYFDPTTRDNQEVRQALSYFLPVYCYSLRENQDRMRSVAVDVMHSLFNMHEAFDGDSEDSEMVNLSTIGAHLVDWTDPRKCYAPGTAPGLGDEGSKKGVNGDVHLDLARDILDRLNTNITKEEKRILSPVLGRLHISPASSEDKIRDVYNEVAVAVEEKLLTDTTGRNALSKLHVSLGKIVNGLNEREKQGPGLGRKSMLPDSARTSATPEDDPTVLPAKEDAGPGRKSMPPDAGRTSATPDDDATALPAREEDSGPDEKTEVAPEKAETAPEKAEVAPEKAETPPKKARGRPKKAKKVAVQADDEGSEGGVIVVDLEAVKARRDTLVSALLSDDDGVL